MIQEYHNFGILKKWRDSVMTVNTLKEYYWSDEEE